MVLLNFTSKAKADLARREAARDIAADAEFGGWFDPDFAAELFGGVVDGEPIAAVVDLLLPAVEDAEVWAA